MSAPKRCYICGDLIEDDAPRTTRCSVCEEARNDPPAAAASPVPEIATLPGVEAAAVLLGRIRSIVLAWKRGGGDDEDGADPHGALVAIAGLLDPSDTSADRERHEYGVRMGWLEDDGTIEEQKR